MNFVEMYVEVESMTESKTGTNEMAYTISVTDNERVKTEKMIQSYRKCI